MFLYEITNKITGMGYVGITKGRVKQRWWSHKKDLKTNKHGNRWLQNAYNKYGPDAFEYKVRQKCNSLEELSNLEKQILKDEKDRLYNIREGGYDAPPVKHTEEAKRKIGKASEIPIVGMCVKTGEIREYKSSVQAGKDGHGYKSIGRCCKLSVSTSGGRTRMAISTKGWVWMHKSEFNMEEMLRRCEMARRRGNNDQSRAVMGKSLIDGSVVKFRSAVEAGKALKQYHPAIRGACLWKENKSASQYVWVFADESEPTILLEDRYRYALKTFNGHKVIGPRLKRKGIKKDQ